MITWVGVGAGVGAGGGFSSGACRRSWAGVGVSTWDFGSFHFLFFGFFSGNSLIKSLELIRSLGTISAMATVRRSNFNILN